MDRAEAVTHLPPAYRRALQWLAEGRSRDEIAAALGIDPLAVDPLVRIAEAKLASQERLPATPNDTRRTEA